MSKKEKTLELLLEQKLLPLFYHEIAEVSIGILQALYDGGIRIAEYTNRGEAAFDNFKAMKKAADKTMPGLYLGIGTIKTKKQAKKFAEAGADFIICPCMNEGVAKAAEDAKLLWIPGCMTPTEIAAAEDAGASIVKIFPGNILGPSYISSVKDIFPGMMFIPTGGVEAEENNLREWFKAGVIGVGIGSRLITKSITEQKDYAGLKIATEKALELVKNCYNI